MEKNREKRIGAVIPAAGFSSRMGAFKPLLPIGDKTPVRILAETLKQAAVEPVVFVTGHGRDLLEPELEKTGCAFVCNPDFEKGMFTSIRAGVRALFEDVPEELAPDGFFLLPADHPLIPPAVLRKLLKAHERQPEALVVPCYQGKKGHPLLIPACYVPEILAADENGSLKLITNKYENRLIRLEVFQEGVVLDMDTEEDYKNLLVYYNEHRNPDKETCLDMLARYGTPPHVVRHCQSVADVALRMGRALNETGLSLDLRLLQAAGLLHDIARVEKDHWLIGAALLREYGWEDTAELVEHHMYHSFDIAGGSICELDILCLADRMVREDVYVGLGKRMGSILEKFRYKPGAEERIARLLAESREFKHQIERRIGRTVEELFQEPAVEPDRPEPLLPEGRRLYLIRHGEIRQHREKIFLGQADIPLSERGRLQAQEAGEKLKALGPQTKVVYSSDLSRALETAEIIAGICGMEAEGLPDFREMSLGSWDGRYISEIQKEFPEAYERRGSNLLTFKEEEQSENFYDLQYRVVKGLRKLIAKTEGDIVLVCHKGVIQVLTAFLEQKPLEDALRQTIPTGDIIVVSEGIT